MNDLRFALRGFRRSPAFVATAVLTIALGLGWNTSVFTIFDAYVLRPLAIRDPGSLYEVAFQDRRGWGQSLSWQQYQDVRALSIASESFACTNAFARSERRPMFGSVMTGDAFRVLGAAPALGRTLLPEDAAPPAGEPVLVLSHDAWQGKFGGDSGIIGRKVVVHGIPLTVVGVAAQRFTGIGPLPPDFWAPVTLLSRLEGSDDLFGAKEPEVLRAVLRLKPGVDERQARAALLTWAANATAALPDSLRWTHVDLVSVASALALTPETIAMFTPAVGAFGLVLLIASANVANAVLAFGLVPALQATRPQIVQASRGDVDRTSRPGRMRTTLVVGQIGICCLLLIVTGVLLRGARKADRLPTGMRTSDVVELDLDDHARDAALRRLRSEPIVADLGASMQAPLDGMYPSLGVRVSGAPRIAVAGVDFVDAGFFRVLDVPIVRGRAFTADEERQAAPVAVVSEAAALALWPGGDPIGQFVVQSAEPPRQSALARVRSARVIGVSRNAVSGWIGTGLERPVIYYPKRADSAGTKILARVSGDASQARQRIDRDIGAVDQSAVIEIHTLEDYLAVQRWPFKIFSWAASAIGAIALLLTLIGIYGVLSYLVAQRTKEIGIRMALGATVPAVVGHVVQQAFRYAAIGIAAGSVLALGVSKLFASVLFIVDTFDPAGYAFGAAVVLAACLLAAWAPSRRGARAGCPAAPRRGK